MASPPKITITKKLEADLREFVAEVSSAGGCERGQKVARQLIARIDDAREKKEATKGLSPYDFVKHARAGCPTVLVPPDITGPLLGMIKHKVALLGLDGDLVEKAAIRARHSLRQPMALTYFVKVIDSFVGDRPEEVSTNDDEGEPRVIDGRG